MQQETLMAQGFLDYSPSCARTEMIGLCCIGEPEAQFAPRVCVYQAARRNSRFTKRTSPAAPDSSMRHCLLRIMCMTSKPLIVAEAVGKVLNPRVGLISRLSAPLPDGGL
jgi:hypothetical protein